MRKLLFMGILFGVANFATVVEGGLAISSDPKIPESLVLEARSSIERGVNFLTDKQDTNGSWMHSPSITSLCAIALHNAGKNQNDEIRIAAVAKARKFILSNVRKNGSICGKDGRYANYATSICLSALAIMGNKADEDIMRKARHFLIGQQMTEERLAFLKEKYKPYKKVIDILVKEKDNPFLDGLGLDHKKVEKVYKKYQDFASSDITKKNPFYGGIGYGSGGPTVPDLSNTSWALEALYLTDYLDSDINAKKTEDIKKSKLAWGRAVEFLRKVQRIPESSDTTWVVKDGDKHDGGFVYQPGYSKVNDKGRDGKNKLGDPNQEGLRSYGSMTYAGLKSMIYAKLDKDDFRVKAASDWAKKHYTLDENPVMGPEGHYFYLQCFAKAHSVLGDNTIVTPDGKKHQWRVELIRKLLGLQKSNGEWYNDKNGRWWESVPQLVTAYSLIAMEVAMGSKIQH